MQSAVPIARKKLKIAPRAIDIGIIRIELKRPATTEWSLMHRPVRISWLPMIKIIEDVSGKREIIVN